MAGIGCRNLPATPPPAPAPEPAPASTGQRQPAQVRAQLPQPLPPQPAAALTDFTPNPRQASMLLAVRTEQQLSVEALAQRFGVTLQTVRRDIKLLADAGLLQRFHGGARLPSSSGSTTENIAYRQRQQLHAAAKQAIAQAVARAVPEGASLFINLGTTTEAVARALLGHRGLRVITNNLNVAAILADNPQCEVIVAGGVVRHRDRGIVGEATVEFISQFKVDIGLIGISGLESDGTLRDFDLAEVKVAQAIVRASRQVWLVADHSKFNRPAMVALGRLDQVQRLFTDQPPPAPFDQLLAEAGVAWQAAAAGPAPAASSATAASSAPAASAAPAA